nr:uncharacterized protein LOC115107382 [Oncorhynchus nerka]
MRKLLGGSFESPEYSLHKEARESSQMTTRKLFIQSSQVSPSPPLADRSSSVRAQSRSPPSPPCSGSPSRFSSRVLDQRSPFLSIRSASVVLTPSPYPPYAPSPGSQGSLRARHLKPSRSSVSPLSEMCSLVELFPEALDALAEIFSEDLPSDDAISERSGVSDEFNINIMTPDDLAPVTLGMSEKKKGKKVCDNDSQWYWRCEERIPSEESEIKTETDRSSVSEISEHLGDRDGDKDALRGHGLQRLRHILERQVLQCLREGQSVPHQPQTTVKSLIHSVAAGLSIPGHLAPTLWLKLSCRLKF